VGSMTACVCVL